MIMLASTGFAILLFHIDLALEVQLFLLHQSFFSSRCCMFCKFDLEFRLYLLPVVSFSVNNKGILHNHAFLNDI